MKLFSATFETLKYAVPMVGARVIGNAMGFIGMLMIAHLGHKQLAAGALVSSTSMTLLVIFWSFLFAAGVIIAPYFARKEHEEIGEIVRQIWLLGLLLAIPLCIIFLSVGPALLWMGQEKALVVLVSQYFHVLVWAVPPSFIFIGSMQFMTAVGKPKIVAYITMIEFIIMLPLGYGLVFGKLGLPNLGMVGMAYANVVTYWIGMIASLLWIRFYKHFQAFNIFKFKKPANYRHLKKQWQLRSKYFGKDISTDILLYSILTTLDPLWVDHLTALDDLRDGVRLRGYAQKDPLIEYRKEGFEMFQNLMGQFETNLSKKLFRLEPVEKPKDIPKNVTEGRGDVPGQEENKRETKPNSPKPVTQNQNKINRNDPCWCGSGKKWKKCH